MRINKHSVANMGGPVNSSESSVIFIRHVTEANRQKHVQPNVNTPIQQTLDLSQVVLILQQGGKMQPIIALTVYSERSVHAPSHNSVSAAGGLVVLGRSKQNQE